MDFDKFTRRDFLKGALAAAALAGSAGSLHSCVTTEKSPLEPGVDAALNSGARVMWIAAHPDDESMSGSILLYASKVCKAPLYFLVLTRGDGGECCIPEGCKPDLATVRAEELKKVAALYGAQLQNESYFNAPLPVESFPKRHEIAKKWAAVKDPAIVCAEAIRRFRPTVVFTFDPFTGYTQHPEHQLASRFGMAGARMALDPEAKLEGAPIEIKHFYFVLNRYWPFRLAGAGDEGPVTETWDATRPCKDGWSCRDLCAEYTKPHKTQENDMGGVREFVALFNRLYLRKYDPYKNVLDPYETVA